MEKSMQKFIALLLLSSIFVGAQARVVDTQTNANLSKKNFIINNLPGLNQKVSTQYSGLFPVDKANDSHLFFWLIEAQQSPEKAPLIIWLNGGAGCSSMLGLFLENGPFRVQADQTLSLNSASWNQKANILFLDQPAGAGFSYTKQEQGKLTVDQIQDQLGIHFYAFLKQFFTVFPEYQDRQLFIAGESFAGNYIPHIATYILEQNRKQQSPPVNLVGLLLLAAWVNPVSHYGSYADYAYALGIIEHNDKVAIEETFKVCKQELEKDEPGYPCYQIQPTIRQVSGYGSLMLNSEDARMYVKYDEKSMPLDYPLGLTELRQYLQNQAVVKAIHATASPETWNECRLLADVQKIINNPTQKLIPALLDQMPILFANGQFDFVINPIGTEQFLYQLKWPFQKAFQDAKRETWVYKEWPVGYSKSYGNLTAVVVLGAGHWIPMDVPEPTLDLINQFITNVSSKNSK
jgi:carboxypeptidase C (cathepsin A)